MQFKINGLTEVQYKACMKLLASDCEKWKIKMTREEALSKLFTVGGSSETDKMFIARLEALGLIKFEEITVENAIVQARANTLNTENFISHLRKNGYEIVKVKNV